MAYTVDIGTAAAREHMRVQLKNNCNALNEKKRRLQKKLCINSRELRQADGVNEALLAKHIELNNELRLTKMMEAEFSHTMHMLYVL